MSDPERNECSYSEKPNDSDLISRQEALKALRPIMRKSDYFYEILKAIQDIPSAQPEKRTDKRTETHACDLIDRQEAIKVATRFRVTPGGEIFEAIRMAVKTELEQLPAAQPERKTGVWESTDDGWDGEYFVCSVCGCPWTLIEGSPEDNGMNFCPNCGADMRGEQK